MNIQRNPSKQQRYIDVNISRLFEDVRFHSSTQPDSPNGQNESHIPCDSPVEYLKYHGIMTEDPLKLFIYSPTGAMTFYGSRFRLV